MVLETVPQDHPNRRNSTARHQRAPRTPVLGEELEQGPRVPLIHAYLEDLLDRLAAVAKAIPLDALFLDALKKTWGNAIV